MSTKIIKASAAEPDSFETSISQALVELETNSDLKVQLRELYITKAKEIELHNRKSIIIYVPMPKLKAFQKIQIRLVRELERKFSGKHVVFVGDKILPKPSHKTCVANKQKQGDDYKYFTVIIKLSKEEILQVSDLINSPPSTAKYKAIKEDHMRRRNNANFKNY